MNVVILATDGSTYVALGMAIVVVALFICFICSENSH